MFTYLNAFAYHMSSQSHDESNQNINSIYTNISQNTQCDTAWKYWQYKNTKEFLNLPSCKTLPLDHLRNAKLSPQTAYVNRLKCQLHSKCIYIASIKMTFSTLANGKVGSIRNFFRVLLRWSKNCVPGGMLCFPTEHIYYDNLRYTQSIVHLGDNSNPIKIRYIRLRTKTVPLCRCFFAAFLFFVSGFNGNCIFYFAFFFRHR